jgi:hypothetical protein
MYGESSNSFGFSWNDYELYRIEWDRHMRRLRCVIELLSYKIVRRLCGSNDHAYSGCPRGTEIQNISISELVGDVRRTK